MTFYVAVLWCQGPAAAWAVQRHGGAEGLVAHEIGHALFVICVSYVLLKLHRSGARTPGWREFKVFLGLIIAWNILTFSGHWLAEYVEPAKYIHRADELVAFRIDGLTDAYFYLTRLDHLLLVPAFIYLYLALLGWRRRT